MTEEITHREKKGKYLKQKINGYSTEIGVLDSNIGRSCFLHLGCYAKPIWDDRDLGDLIKLFERKLRFWSDSAVGELFSEILDTKMPIIKNVESSDTTFTANKKRVNNSYTYVSIELTLFFNQKIDIREQQMIDRLSLLLYSLVDFLDENQDLSFKPTRS